MTSTRDLIIALAEEQSAPVRKLERIFTDAEGNRVSVEEHPHFPELATPHHLDTICPTCEKVLEFEPKETEHLNDWPSDVKEEARASIMSALATGLRIHLRWGLSRKATTEAVEYTVAGDIFTVRFVEPYSNIRIEDPTALVGINSNEAWQRKVARKEGREPMAP